MFTGLVEEIGSISEIIKNEKFLRIKISCEKVLVGSLVGDSISTNGVCLTITEMGKNYFYADVMYESVKRSNLKNLKVNSKVNLEKSLTLAKPLGGHLVTGDVDCTGTIINIKQEGIAKIYRIKFDYKYAKYIVEKGRITLDGTSLTISDFGGDWVEVSLIPHSQKSIILGEKNIAYEINIEFDLIGKYVEKLLSFREEKSESITMEKLGRYGFL